MHTGFSPLCRAAERMQVHRGKVEHNILKTDLEAQLNPARDLPYICCQGVGVHSRCAINFILSFPEISDFKFECAVASVSLWLKHEHETRGLRGRSSSLNTNRCLWHRLRRRDVNGWLDAFHSNTAVMHSFGMILPPTTREFTARVPTRPGTSEGDSRTAIMN